MILGSFINDIFNNIVYTILFVGVCMLIVLAVIIYFFVYRKKVKARQQRRKENKEAREAEKVEKQKTASSIFEKRDEINEAKASEPVKDRSSELANRMADELKRAREEGDQFNLATLKEKQRKEELEGQKEQIVHSQAKDQEIANKLNSVLGLKDVSARLDTSQSSEDEVDSKKMSKENKKLGKEIQESLGLNTTALKNDSRIEKHSAEDEEKDEELVESLSSSMRGGFGVAKLDDKKAEKTEEQNEDNEALVDKMTNSLHSLTHEERNEDGHDSN